MKLPKGQRIRWGAIRAVVIFRADKIVWASSRRQCEPIEVTREQSVSDYVCRVGRRQETDNSGIGITGQSLAAIQRVRANTHECCSACKLSCAKIVGIGPHASFWIIGEIISVAGGKFPTVIRTQRIAGL